MPRFLLWLLVCTFPAAAATQPTTTVLTQVSGTPVYGSTLSFRAAVDALLGSVTFVVDGQVLAPVTLDGRGYAFLDYSFTPGSHTVAANYSGSTGVYLASAATALTLEIVKSTPAVTVTNIVAQIGQPVTLTAAIVPPGAGLAGGKVAFASSAVPIAECAAVQVQYRTALCTTTFPTLGSLLITAQYLGDANNNAATGSGQVTVGKVVAGVYLASAPDPAVWGTSTTVNALVLGAGNVAAPTGTVTFTTGGKTLGISHLGADSRASLVADYAVGAYQVTAVYNGDANYLPASPVSLKFAVGKGPTVLTVSSDPAQVSQPTTLRASIALVSGTGAIGGTVDFMVDGKPVCTGLPVAGGKVSCATSFPSLATYTVAANYSGDANTLASTAALPVTVGQAVPAVYLASTPSSPVFGQDVWLDALVLGAGGLPAPSGSIAFTDGGRTLATQPIGADGRAYYTATLAAGTHTIAATYSGDANYQTASPTARTLTVAKAATVTTVTALTGGPFTARINVAKPGSGTPSGTVQFRSGSTTVGSAPVTAQGSVVSATLSASNATGAIAAVYTGDANFVASTSDAVTVYPVQTIVTLTSDNNPAPAGPSLAITAAVSVTPRALAGPPTGSVGLSVDGKSLETTALTSGQAVFHATLAPGTHALTATYSGDTSYPTSSGSLTQIVVAGASALTLAGSSPTSVYGQPVTFTASLHDRNTAGLVQFADGANSLGSLPLVDGAASLVVVLPAGTHNITASWSGDGVSAHVVHTVEKASTAIALAVSPESLLATVTAAAPGAGSPTGTLRFLDPASGNVLATASLKAAAATVPLPTTADAVVASYSGDLNFQGGISQTLRLLAVTNAASYAVGSVAPDELVTIFAPSLPENATVKIVDTLGTAHPAPLVFLSATQASFIIPASVPFGPASLAVTGPGRVLSTPLIVDATAPGLFSAAQVITVHADGTRDEPQPDAGPIHVDEPGSKVYLVLYGTGLRHMGTAPVCAIGGRTVPVLYAGPQADIAGLDQVNVELPANLSGSLPVVLTIDGHETNPVLLLFQ
jgi:uncharacterized protein (TIGR03437 family)